MDHLQFKKLKRKNKQVSSYLDYVVLIVMVLPSAFLHHQQVLDV